MAFQLEQGDFIGANQVNEVAPLADSVTALFQGTLMKRNANGEWEVGAAADAGTATEDGAELYLSLHDKDDYQADMAGKHTGLTLRDGDVLVTSIYDTAATFSVGDHVTVGANGEFTSHASGNTSHGTIVTPPFSSQDSVSSANQGGRLTMIRIKIRRVSQLASA